MSIVTIQYDDLVSGKDVCELISRAFGPDGLGALTIANIPQYAELRAKLLPLSHRLAHLPSEQLRELEHSASLWNVGWSHGKEKLGNNPDTAKGSFYANPIYDDPAPSKEVFEANPYSYPKNIWPTSSIPALEVAFKDLGQLMTKVAILFSSHVEKLIKQHVPTYEPTLTDALERSRRVKGRLLYYYPTSADNEDSWIGWHNDSGFITTLTSAIFFDDDTGEIIPNPDPNGGLWVVDRKGSAVNVKIPADHLAIQCGECLQVISGLLVATPHAVKASKDPSGRSIGRSSFPVFVGTDTDFVLKTPPGTNRQEVFDKSPDSRVPPLAQRWTGDDQTYGQFVNKTFEMYYQWNKGTASY